MMTESGPENATNLWEAPECPFQIETSARVLEDIRLAIVDAFFSLPRGGAEIGGILLGSYQPGRLTITGYAAVECEHAFGPSFTLSPPDEARLKMLLAERANGAAGTQPVGWYHSHTRSEILLSDADLEIHKRYFPKAWQVALVIKPHTFQPARIGFFFRDADGNMRSQSSYRETVLEALPMRQMPNGAPSATPVDEQSPLRRYRAEPPSADLEISAQPLPLATAPMPPLEPAPKWDPLPEPSVDLPVPRFLAATAPPSRRWMWVVGISVTLGAGAAGFQTRQAWLPQVQGRFPQVVAAVSPAPDPPAAQPALGLNTIDRDGQLQINWDRNSSALLNSGNAVLEIMDGGPTAQAILLDSAHLKTGSFTYARQAAKVDVMLIVHQANGPDIREVASFLGKLPERKPIEDPEVQKQREEIARQAARLKTDLNFQAAKTKKLEKDLESMREEMKQQQMKRLNNQLPDK